MGRRLKNNGKMLQSYGLWLDDYEFNVCQIDVLYGKSLIIDFLDDFLKKRTAIFYTSIFLFLFWTHFVRHYFHDLGLVELSQAELS